MRNAREAGCQQPEIFGFFSGPSDRGGLPVLQHPTVNATVHPSDPVNHNLSEKPGLPEVRTRVAKQPEKPEPPAAGSAFTELAQLAGALAHEVRNPLSVIRLNVELLQDELDEIQTPESRRAIQKIEVVKRQCTRLENLLNDFLQFTRLGKLALKPGSLNEQLEQVLDFYESTARQQNVEVVRYLDAELPFVMLDSSTLQAALMNLVKNALEAMPDGGRLEVRTRTTLKGVALDLIDTGCGMDETTLFNMFEKFYSSKRGGTGLGLPTARKIIEAHDGLIDVQSAVGRGTKFTLFFPTPKRI
jgi:signal transduction histidine kinase